MRISFLFFLVFYLSGSIFAQDVKVIPPSPEAASLFKSLDVPVSMYAGTPSIAYEIYTIKTKELSIPIQLDYNARGIQVAEVASRAGIGWSLQYGGMISRQIRGFADEMGGVYFHNFYPEAFKTPEGLSQMQDGALNGSLDEYLDEFYYNINGESGKFFFDYNDKKIVLQKFSDIKITPIIDIEDGFVGWIAIDKAGNKFFYGKSKDSTRTVIDYDLARQNYSFSSRSGMKDLGSSDDTNNSSWYLTEIQTYLGERIEFFYEEESGIQYKRSQDRVVNIPSLSPESPPSEDVSSFFSRVYSYQNQVSEIRFPGGKVIFQKDSIERKDYTNTFPLKYVTVLDSNGQVVKKVELTHFYQRSNDDFNQLAYLKQIDTSSNYRLFLSSIREIGRSGDSLPAQQFIYSDVKLPNRFSNSQDSWGYFNGKPNGPYLTFTDELNHINREVDTVLSKAGMLKKIIYPTGGHTIFTYEQNRVIAPSFMDSVLTSITNPTDTIEKHVSFFRDNKYYLNEEGMYSQQFNMGTNLVGGNVHFEFILPSYADTNISYYQVTLERLDSSYGVYIYPPHINWQFYLAPGVYRLNVIPTGNGDTIPFIASINWSQVVTNPHNLGSGEWYGAGNRIKRIDQYSANKLASFRQYEYLKEDGSCSGVMHGLPYFHFIWKYFDLGGGNFSPVPQMISLNGEPFNAIRGNSVGYSRVTEYYGDSLTNQGKTVYDFTNDPNGGKYYKFPFTIPIDFEWLRGKPVSTKVYRKSGTDYQLLRSEDNLYWYGGEVGGSGIFDGPVFMHEEGDSAYVYRKDRGVVWLPQLQLAVDVNGDLATKVFYQTAGIFALRRTSIKEYNGEENLSRQSFYTYNFPYHYQSTGVKSVNSKGDSVISNIQYPSDIVSRSTAEEKLILKHRLSDPVYQTNIVKNNSGTVLSTKSSHTVYKDWGDSLVFPEIIQSSINGYAYEDELTYIKYNREGSPLEVISKAGVKEVYVWGYEKQYPVAKVTGSDYATVIALVDTTLLNNAANYTDLQVRTELNKIRTGLSSSLIQVTTYTYQPLVGVTSVTDPNNRKAFYEYDEFNRLSLVRDNDSNIVSKVCYNYAGQPEACGLTIYKNVAKSGNFTRNNCASGGVGGTVTYTVAANTYSSTVSQAAADALAQADVDANGQTYANTHTGCTWYSVAKSGNFTRNNCASSGVGGTVTYTVAANTYSSTVSQAAADALAQADVDANGQTYANTHASCTWYSVAKSGNFTRNNCASGGSGGTVTYTVAANTYSSTVSQAAADALAQADVDANGQAYANTHANCTWYSVAKSGNFTRNNCSSGGVGGTVTYTVAANTYSSIISQADADAQAQAAVDANGQTYANTNATCAWYNVEKSGNFVRNNCASGYTGSTVTYTVAAGTYSSTISQEHADNAAQINVNNSGQAYANANGTCTATCNSSNCTGAQYKCVSGSCEKGVKVYTESYYDDELGGNVCVYHYEWSDNSWSQDYTQFMGAFNCAIN